MNTLHHEKSPVAILAIGGTGAAVLDNLAVSCEGEHRTVCVDTDALALRGTVAQKKILVAPERVHGMGTGGEPELLEGTTLEEGDGLNPILMGIKTAIVVLSTAGGTGSAMGPSLVRRLKAQATEVVVMAVTPFTFEGARRKDRAMHCLAEMRKSADVVLTFSCDRLLETSLAKDLKEAQRAMDKAMAKVVIVDLDRRMAMAVLPANRKVVLQDLRELTANGQVRFASEEQFKARFPDCEIGAMPPFGNLYGMEVFVSEELSRSREIAFNAGSHVEVIRMAYADFERLVQPKVLAFTN